MGIVPGAILSGRNGQYESTRSGIFGAGTGENVPKKGTYILLCYACRMVRKTKQIKCSFYTDPERLAKLKEISRRTMIPMSALMRKALDHVIREYSR